MTNNIVVFGPVDSGKSTLIGYMHVMTNLDHDFDNIVSKWKKESWYRPEQKFAYVVDTSESERYGYDLKQPENIKIQSSKKIYTAGIATSQDSHSRRVFFQNNEFLFWDTPGHPKYFESKVGKQLLGSQLGLFLIDVNLPERLLHKISKEPYGSFFDRNYSILMELMLPIRLWFKLGNQKNTIILMTKVDTINFDKFEYQNALEALNDIMSFIDIDIGDTSKFPIAIDVDNELDYNVMTLANKTSELCTLNGKETLLEYIKNHFNKKPNLLEAINSSKFIMNISRAHINKPVSEEIFQGNIISGKIRIGDIVNISPCFFDHDFGTINGEVSSIKLEDGPKVDDAQEGNFIGIGLRNTKSAKSKRRIKRFRAVKDTCIITNQHISLLHGSIIDFKIDEDHQLKTGYHIKIYWFGIHINASILMVKNDIITVFLIGKLVAVPIQRNDNIIFNKFIIYRKENGFINSTLVNVGFLQSLTIIVSDQFIDLDKLRNTAYRHLGERIIIEHKKSCYIVNATCSEINYSSTKYAIDGSAAISKTLHNNISSIDYLVFNSTSY